MLWILDPLSASAVLKESKSDSKSKKEANSELTEENEKEEDRKRLQREEERSLHPYIQIIISLSIQMYYMYCHDSAAMRWLESRYFVNYKIDFASSVLHNKDIFSSCF